MTNRNTGLVPYGGRAYPERVNRGGVTDVTVVDVSYESVGSGRSGGGYNSPPPPSRPTPPPSSPTPRPARRNNLPWIIGGALLALLMILTFLFLLLGGNGGQEFILWHEDDVPHDVSPDGSYTVDPDVTFTDGPEPQLVTEQVEVSSNGVLIHYRWIHAPSGSYTFSGEVWDHSVGGNERMLFHQRGEDRGSIFVPVSNWSGATHARVVATGPNQTWQESGGFVAFTAPAAAAPAPEQTPETESAPVETTPTPDTSGNGEERILDPNVSWD